MPPNRVPFVLLSVLIWALVTFAPNGGAGGDAWGSLLTAQALVEHGSFDLSPYTDRAVYNEFQFFRVGGALYYGYPPGTPMLEAPLVALARLAGLDMVNPAHESLLERQVCALCMIAVLGALHCGASAFWSGPRAWWAAILVLLASTYSGSIASSMANSQLLEIVFLTWTQAWLLRFDQQGGSLRGWVVGLFLGLAYWCRPTALLWAPFVMLYLAARKREALPGALLASGALVLAFKLALVPFWGGAHPYYGPRSLVWNWPQFCLQWLGVLVSPGVGLIPFQPVLLPALLVAPVLLRRRLLAWMFFLYANAHIVVVALQTTWMTVAFGPRLQAEACFPLWFLVAMLWSGRSWALDQPAGWARHLIWPALLWCLWLNTYVAFFRQTQHLHYTATRPEQDPTARGLWEWRLAPYLVDQQTLWDLIRQAPADLFPALTNPIRRGFLPPEQVGDQFLVRPEGARAYLGFQAQTQVSAGLVWIRYSSDRKAEVQFNGHRLARLPASRAVRRQTCQVREVEWRQNNELEFLAGPDFRLFDVVAQAAPADVPGILGYQEGFSGDEGGTRWAYGPYSKALLVVRRQGWVRLSCQALSPQRQLDVEIWCNGKHCADFRGLPEGENQLSFAVPAQAGDNLLEFRFNHWGVEGSRDQRPLALRLREVRISWRDGQPGPDARPD